MSTNQNGGSKVMAEFSYEREVYTPTALLNIIREDPEAYKALRKEYSTFRAIAQKRLKRLGESVFSESQTYKKYKNKFKKLDEIKTPQEFAQRLSSLERFIHKKTSTIKGQVEIMRESLGTLHENGYDFVNEDNFIAYGQFMEEYRNQLLDMEYDSGEAAETFNVLEKKKIDPTAVKAEFELFLKEHEELAAMKIPKHLRQNPEKIAKKLEARVKIRENRKKKRSSKLNIKAPSKKKRTGKWRESR